MRWLWNGPSVLESLPRIFYVIILVFMKALQTRLVCDCQCSLAEGPVWFENKLWWVDIPGHAFFCSSLDGTFERWEWSSYVSLIVPTTSGRVLIATERGLLLGTPGEPEEQWQVFAHPLQGKEHEVRYNDGKVDPWGRLWVGSMGLKGQPNLGELFIVDTQGTSTRLLEGVTISNGLAWKTDPEPLAYYIDTPTQEVTEYALDLETYQLGPSRPAVKIPPEIGHPDGMCIDHEGALWIALLRGRGLGRYDPVSGEPVARVDVPVENVTSCCFGGPDFSTLYMTTSGGDSPPEKKASQPHAGGIFALDLPFHGETPNLFPV